MGWLSDNAGAVVGGVLGLGGSLWSSNANAEAAAAQIAFQREVLKNRNQWAVEDLKKAGLNPILAAGAIQSTASGASYTTENPGAAAVASAAQMQAMKLAQRQQDNQDAIARAQVEVSSAKAFELREKASTYAPMVTEIGERTKTYAPQALMFGSSASLNSANVDYLSKQGQEVYARVKKLESDLVTAEKQRSLYEAEIKNVGSQTSRNVVEANLARTEMIINTLKAEGQKLINDGIEITNQLKSLEVKKSSAVSSVYGDVDTILSGLRRLGQRFFKHSNPSTKGW